ncbi:MAG TPA: T9SS type A sorting domain-containing protein [Bacteroidia bacterium]|nr:T9SS type A sorting domain-containing protein [Bacteroidia bacterium]
MMKKIILCLILFSTAFAGKGQNLVPNESFETYSTCPNSVGQINKAVPWMNPAPISTPDYFHNCSSPMPVGQPLNYLGYQPAQFGFGYAGIGLYSFLGTNSREYIEIQLISPLIAGQCYRFGMYINSPNSVAFITDDVAAYFSDTLITGINNGFVLPFTPQVNNATGNFPDTVNWKYATGTFTAAGGESYLLIGNFKTDANTTAILIDSTSMQTSAYVYIDNVSVSTCFPASIHNPAKEGIEIYPNPVTDYLKINYPLAGKEKAGIKITDVLGKEIYCNQFSNSKFQIPTSNFKNGIYFIEINDGKNIYRKKFLKE